jgi:hypothetical protein
MKKTLRRSLIPAAVLAAALTGGLTLSHAQSAKQQLPDTRSKFLAESDPSGRPSDSRDIRSVIEDLENCSPEEVSSGQIGRFFTDPAVIVTNGRAHHIDWQRIQPDRPLDRNPDDRNGNPNDDRFRRNPDDRNDDTLHRNPADQPDRLDSDVQIEDFQVRRIDPRTVVALYTAVIPDGDNVIHQPVVATLVREYSDSPWRVATYTAENAAIPGSSNFAPDDSNRAPVR